ncbi:MAG: sugar ABC transporter substrate-binding protein [Actinobacteria bacterium HGW-Actinobacteria-4]|nr:MAG: sugar ABC transporter substrate-binding protein [Actinobacteria bacterium HGW-Actinobacteria-4]
MKRRIISPIAAIAASGLILAGCSTSDPEPTGTTPGGGTVAAGCEDYAAYGTHDGASVEVYATIQGVEADQLVATFDDFTECTGITVNYVGTQEFETQINVRVEGGSPPDLAIFPQPGLLERIVATGNVVAAPAAVEANVDEYWSESWKQYGTIDGTFYAAPLMASVKGWIWYSPSEFAENGYEVPGTWDEMMDLTATMAAANTSATYAPWCIGFESGVATGWPGTDWLEDIVLRQAGADVYDQWVAGDVKFSDPQIVAAFDTFGDIALNPDYVNGGFGGPESIVSTSFNNGGLPILTGDCSMHHQASFYEAQWPEGTDVSENGDVWAFITPKMNASDPDAVTGGGEFVAAFNDNAATAAVQAYMASAEWANARVSLGGVISANKGLDPTNASSPIGQASIEILQGENTVFRFDASDLMPAAVGAASFWTGITDWVAGTRTTDETVAFIDSTWP